MTTLGRECRAMIICALRKYGLPDSEAAIRLLCMIAGHESGQFMYTRQGGDGPALSHFQIEPGTAGEIFAYAKRKPLILLRADLPENPEALVFNPFLAAACARVYYMMDADPLPHADDFEGLANYAKRRWNTERGAAEPYDYLHAYQRDFS